MDPCPAKYPKCNTFSPVEPIEASQDQYCLHQEDLVDHKCYEACANSRFNITGVTGTGKCPIKYDTVDKTAIVTQCPDGMTNPRYCSPINVTVNTKGEGDVALMQPDTITKHYEYPSEPGHCEDVTVHNPSVEFWKDFGWRYEQWFDGLCPPKYNFVNKEEKLATGIEHRYMGIKPSVPSTGESLVGGPPPPVTGYVHTVGTDGADKGLCLLITYPGGPASPFWWDQSWHYPKPKWSAGLCDEKKFPTQKDKKVLDGWTSAKNAGYGDVTKTRFNPASTVGAEASKCNSYDTIKTCKAAGCAWSHYGCLTLTPPH